MKHVAWLLLMYCLGGFAQLRDDGNVSPVPDRTDPPSRDRCSGQDYYYVSGETICLEPSRRSVAYAVTTGADNDALSSFLQDRGDNLVKADFPQFEKSGLVVLRANPAQAPERAEEIIDELRAMDFGLPAAPTFMIDGVEIILTDRFTVEFVDGVDADRAAAYLSSELGATEISKDQRRPNKYRFRMRQSGPLESLRKINEHEGEPPVARAYPNFYRIYPARNDSASRARGPDGSVSARQLSGFGYTSCDMDGPGGGDPDDPYFPNQWALDNNGQNPLAGGTPHADIRALDAWAMTEAIPDIPEIKIALIDVGVDREHPDLKDRIDDGIGKTIGGAGFGDADFGDSSHGTAVAGLAAASTNNAIGIAGVERHARIIPIRFGVVSNAGTTTGPFEDEAEAIDTAVSLGAHVLVNSWNDFVGGPPVPGLDTAIADALGSPNNTVVVFSAGNHFDADCTLGNQYCDKSVRYPATLVSSGGIFEEALIVVSATNNKDQFQTIDAETAITASENVIDSWGSSRGPEVTIAAPGVRLYTTAIPKLPDEDGIEPDNNGYGCFSGTSASAPLAGGAAALLLSVHPYAKPAEIKEWLQDGADDPPSLYTLSDPNDFFGHGRLNIAGALDKAAVDLRLQVERITESWEPDESLWVRAIVSRGGHPVSGIEVTFEASGFLFFGGLKVSPTSAVTDASGVAVTTVGRARGEAFRGTISARAATTTASTLVHPTRMWWIAERWLQWYEN